VGAGDAGHFVTEAFNQLLDIHGNEGFILDDEDFSGDLTRDLGGGLIEQGRKFIG